MRGLRAVPFGQICTMLAVPFAFASAGAAPVASEPVGGSGIIEEIVVTAQKREQQLIDVPIAVSAFSERDIENAGIHTLSGLSAIVPNFQMESELTSRNNRILIRGISAYTAAVGAEPSVGVYVDGVYYAGSAVLNVDLLDVERIEILRGPQGTLFGKNTSVGAVNITSRKPGREMSAFVEAMYGNHDHSRARARLEIPVAESLSVQGSALVESRDGLVDNPVLDEELDDLDRYAGRVAARFDNDGPLIIDVAMDYLKDRSTGKVLNPTPFDRVVMRDDPFEGYRKVWGGHVTGVYDFNGSSSLTSITGYREHELRITGESDQGANPDIFKAVQDSLEKNRTVSQELRLVSEPNDRLEWILGAYYYGADFSWDVHADLLLFGIQPIAVRSLSQIDTSSIAGFGEATISISERLSMTLGGRYTHEEKEVEYSTAQGPLPLPEFSSNSFSPKAVLSFRPSPSHHVFISYTRGSKSGGVNPGVAGAAVAEVPDDLLVFDDEQSENYEVGVKSRLFERRLQVGASAFYIDYEDLQANQFVLINGFLPGNVVTNAGKATSRGIEIEMLGLLSDRLEIRGAFGYTWGKYEQFEDCAQDVSCTGNRLLNAPRSTASLGFRYTKPIARGLDGFIGANWAYTGSAYPDVFNSPDSRNASFSLFDAQVGITGNERWTLTLWGKNIGDEDYYSAFVAATPAFGLPAMYTAGTPTTYGLTATASF